MTRIRLVRIVWIGAAAILVAAALVALVAVLRGDFSDTDGRILGTLGATLLAGSALVAGTALAERGARRLGWLVSALAVPAFLLVVYAIWGFVFDGGGDSWRYGWTGVVSLVAALVAAGARLLARSRALASLAASAGVLAAAAAATSIAAIWRDDPGETFGETIAALWILTVLAFLLVPVLQRFGSADAPVVRVLAELDSVELVASRKHVDGVLADSPARGERLVLRRGP